MKVSFGTGLFLNFSKKARFFGLFRFFSENLEVFGKVPTIKSALVASYKKIWKF